MSDARFPCPCCGYATLYEAPPGSYGQCPICYWEDADEWAANGVSLREAQQSFIARGACRPEFVERVRAPTDDDVRAPRWQPLFVRDEPARLAARAAIETAFAGMRRGSGMTIYEGELADGYGIASDRAARIRDDVYDEWTEIPADVLEEFAVLAFFDPPSFHFHLPAYLRWTLDCYRTSGSISADYTIYALDPGKAGARLHNWSLERLGMLNDEQGRAVARFLRYAIEFADGELDVLVARQALARHWVRFDSN